jgi:hypothetical protein
MGLVLVSALVFGVIRHPDTLLAGLVPLIGGVCVVLPVLGTIELLTPPSELKPRFGWGGSLLVVAIALVGCVAAMVVGLVVLSLF